MSSEKESPYSLFERGKRLLEEGHPAQAAMVLEKARAEFPGKGSILEVLGRAYYNYGRYGEAALRFKEAVEVDPTNDYAHYCLGRCYLKLNRKADASRHFKLAWNLKPCDMYRKEAFRFGALEQSDI